MLPKNLQIKVSADFIPLDSSNTVYNTATRGHSKKLKKLSAQKSYRTELFTRRIHDTECPSFKHILLVNTIGLGMAKLGYKPSPRMSLLRPGVIKQHKPNLLVTHTLVATK